MTIDLDDFESSGRLTSDHSHAVQASLSITIPWGLLLRAAAAPWDPPRNELLRSPDGGIARSAKHLRLNSVVGWETRSFSAIALSFAPDRQLPLSPRIWRSKRLLFASRRGPRPWSRRALPRSFALRAATHLRYLGLARRGAGTKRARRADAPPCITRAAAHGCPPPRARTRPGFAPPIWPGTAPCPRRSAAPEPHARRWPARSLDTPRRLRWTR